MHIFSATSIDVHITVLSTNCAFIQMSLLDCYIAPMMCNLGTAYSLGSVISE